MILINNSLTNKKQEFMPIKKGHIKMYVCGPTVYDVPHIGHARSAYIFDIIRRYFEYRKFKVTFVRNVTDVDDKIIDKAKKEYANHDLKKGVLDVSNKYLKAYHDDMDALGILPPNKEPKATAYIKKMQAFIKLLIEKEAAYEADGDIYFDITKAKEYGKLSGQSIDQLKEGVRIQASSNKKNPLDFALWKKAKEGEPSWRSPWGDGRPGWHIECSVMSSDILGDEFDIHGGGLDLIFPHHENELAQSEGAGKKFARYWMHHGLLTINKQKMSKSLGNFVTIKDVLEKYSADILKIFFLSADYESPIDFTWERMDECKSALERFYILFDKAQNGKSDKKIKNENNKEIDKLKSDFIEAMDRDFSVPSALSKLFDMVSFANKAGCPETLLYAKKNIFELGSIFGLSFKKESIGSELETFVKEKIKERKQARENKDFAKADQIRDELLVKGIAIEDTKEGTAWRKV